MSSTLLVLSSIPWESSEQEQLKSLLKKYFNDESSNQHLIIDTKYYTVKIDVVFLCIDEKEAIESCERVDFILYETKSEDTLECFLMQVESVMEMHESDTSLVFYNSSDSLTTEGQERVDTFYEDAFIECVVDSMEGMMAKIDEIEPLQGGICDEEKKGFDRIVEALTTNMWTAMVQKPRG